MDRDLVIGRHLLLGWAALFVFLLLGMLLETMHGFKIGFLLDVDNSTRRMMWTLAHAHGALLGIVNIAWALTLGAFPEKTGGYLATTSLSLVAATVLLPGGFFLGGVIIYSGDPGFGILLVPPGGLLLALAVGLTAWQLRR